MDTNSVLETFRLTLLSDIVTIVILTGFLFYLFFRDRKRAPASGRILRWAVAVSLAASAGNLGVYLYLSFPGHLPEIFLIGSYILQEVCLELWFLVLTLYLLYAAGKEETAGRRKVLLTLPAAASCILSVGYMLVNQNRVSIDDALKIALACVGPVIYILICVISLWKENKSLLSVFLVMVITRIYLGFMLEEASAFPAVLALTLIYAYFCVQNRRSLFQLGSVLILLFIVATLVLGSYLMTSVASFYLNILQGNDEKNVIHIRKDFDEYKCFPWLVDYWVSHPEEILDRVKDNASGEDVDEIEQVFEITGGNFVGDVTVEQAEQLPEKYQLAFAAHCYDTFSFLVTYYEQTYSLNDLMIVLPDRDDSGKVTVILDSETEEDGTFRLGVKEDEKQLQESWDNFEKLARPGYMDLDWGQYMLAGSYGYYFEYQHPSDSSGTPLWICLSVSSEEVYEKLTFISGFRRRTIFILTIVALLILILLYVTILKPMAHITKVVSEYEQDKDALRAGEGMKVIRSGNEIGVLAEEFTSLTKEMERYTNDVARMAGERERAQTELRMAAQIQAAALPVAGPAFRDRTEFSLYASMNPAKEVGGDFYDFFHVDEEHLALVIADVSDKGVPAALFMMSAKNLINYRAKSGGSPGEILTEVNAQICENSATEMFVTVWMGILDLTDGRMVCTNAGHEYPMIRGEDGLFHKLKDKHGMVVGGMDGVRYRNYEVKLNPGDAVFVYTDGVPEANDKEQNFYGMERLETALNGVDSADRMSPEKIIHAVDRDVERFVDGADQFDDMTMLCVVYRGKESC